MKLNPILENYRVRTGEYRTKAFEPRGVFQIPNGPCGRSLMVIADDGTDRREPARLLGWEHVSVSCGRQKHTPNWGEMDFIKRLFWDDGECVVQFHPPRSEWVSNAPVLHMWRWLGGEFPQPHRLLVGVQEVGEFKNKADAERARKIVDQQVAAMRGEGNGEG